MHEIVLPKGRNFLEQFRNIGLLLILATELPSSSYIAEYNIVCVPEHFPINHKPLQGRGVTVRCIQIANTLLLVYSLQLSALRKCTPGAGGAIQSASEEIAEESEEEPDARRGRSRDA